MSASRVDPRVRVAELVSAFRRRLRFPLFWLVLTGVLLASSLALLVARRGTPGFRVTAAVAILVVVLALGIWSVLDGRRWQQPRVALARVLGPVDRATAARAERAYGLLVQTERELGGALELAGLHLTRTLDSVPSERVDAASRTRASRLRRLALLVSAALVVLFSSYGVAVLEGALVLGANRGFSRSTLPYVRDFEISVEVPEYLQDESQAGRLFGERVTVPQGSVIAIRILPTALERKWVLSDGLREEDFVSEGSGSWIARLTIVDSVDLRVGARHGEVVVLDSLTLHVETLVDRAPSVVLDQAPREIALEDFERLELDYVAYDDHGLSQIELVVESAGQALRTELSRFDGKQRSFRGGHALERNHPLLAHAFLPVRAYITARDADTVTGPHWGKSQVVTLLPPPLGADAARRYEAFKQFRSKLVAGLASDLDAGRLSLPAARAAKQETRARLPQALAELRTRLVALPDPPQGSLRFLQAQVEMLSNPKSSELALENALLATDVLLRSWSRSQAQETAKELAEMLDELALGAKRAREGESLLESQARLRDQLLAVDQGAQQLAKIGLLGGDLGSVAQADLGRARAAFDEKSFDRLERVAAHLAARLRRGTPSFGSRGSGAVESGPSGESGTPSEGEGSSSSAPGEYDKAMDKAQQLARDHARSLSDLERLLGEAERAAQQDAARDERWPQEAAELRRALEGLPEVGAGPGTASSEAALAKNQGEAMADALEAADLDGAVTRGRDAQAALARARRLAIEQGSALDPSAMDLAARKLEEALNRAAQGRTGQQAQAAQQGGAGLRALAERERELASQTEKLGQQSKGGEAPLPRAALDALRRASERMRASADAMAQGDGEKGRHLAEEAQRELERAQPEQSGQRSADAESSDGKLRTSGEVPGEEKDRGRRFRERVQRGLGQPSGSLSPAVERYAAGLQ